MKTKNKRSSPKIGRFFCPNSAANQKEKKSSRFLCPNSVVDQIEKIKKLSPKLGNANGGGGYFPFQCRNHPQKCWKRGIFYIMHADWGLQPPPWLHYWLRLRVYCLFCIMIFRSQLIANFSTLFWLIYSTFIASWLPSSYGCISSEIIMPHVVNVARSSSLWNEQNLRHSYSSQTVFRTKHCTCKFLWVEVPNVPFPHVNKKASYFREAFQPDPKLISWNNKL